MPDKLRALSLMHRDAGGYIHNAVMWTFR